MKISQLSKRAVMPISTIRFYEKNDLLAQPQRHANNYRDYSESYVSRLQFIKFLTDLGFKLADIRKFLIDLDHGNVKEPDVLLWLEKQTKSIQYQMDHLVKLKEKIESLAKPNSVNTNLITEIQKLINT